VRKIACPVCGQDWLRWYRVKDDGLTFLLCPECDSVWLPGQDPSPTARQDLSELLGCPQVHGTEWDLIEPCAAPHK
jgi:hypothetical protein